MAAPGNTLVELVQYSKWASGKLLSFAQTVPEEVIERAIPNSHGGILKTFQHIYYADRVWTNRLEQVPGAFEDPAPGPSLNDLESLWWPVLGRLANFTAAHAPETEISFRRNNGDSHTVRLEAIVLHVVNHATYHRGQVAALLRQCGHVPPATDLILYHLA